MDKEWITSREVAALLGVSSQNIRQVRGYSELERKGNVGRRGYLYRRSDVLALVEYRKSGASKRDSYVGRQAGNRKAVKPTSAQQIRIKNDRSVPLSVYEQNVARMLELETAVRQGRVKPRYLPSDVRKL